MTILLEFVGNPFISSNLAVILWFTETGSVTTSERIDLLSATYSSYCRLFLSLLLSFGCFCPLSVFTHCMSVSVLWLSICQWCEVVFKYWNLPSPSVYVASSQVLELAEEPRGLPPQFHEVHHQLAFPPLPLHCGVRSAGHAALWRTVSNLCSPVLRSVTSPLLWQTHRHIRVCSSIDVSVWPSFPVSDPWCGGGDRHVDTAGSWQSRSTNWDPFISLSAGAPCCLMTGTPHDSGLAAVNQRLSSPYRHTSHVTSSGTDSKKADCLLLKEENTNKTTSHILQLVICSNSLFVSVLGAWRNFHSFVLNSLGKNSPVSWNPEGIIWGNYNVVRLILNYRHKGYYKDIDIQQHGNNKVQQDASTSSLTS